MIGRILLSGWILIGASFLMLTILPRLGTRVAFLIELRPILVLFTLISFIYGAVQLYRRGIKRL